MNEYAIEFNLVDVFFKHKINNLAAKGFVWKIL